MTEYVILKKDASGYWSVVRNAAGMEIRTASSTSGAIRALLNGENPEGGEYVAIPARSWRPVFVKIETERRVRIG